MKSQCECALTYEVSPANPAQGDPYTVSIFLRNDSKKDIKPQSIAVAVTVNGASSNRPVSLATKEDPARAEDAGRAAGGRLEAGDDELVDGSRRARGRQHVSRPAHLGAAGPARAMTDVLPCVEIDAQGEPAGTVLWLHGLGANGHDFEPIVPLLELPQVRFVFPHAPARGVTINGGLIMPAWYDILALGTAAGGEDADDVRESAAMIEALIAREGERGVPSENVVLAGFSQGGAMALFVGTRHAQPLRGIMVLSGYEVLARTREAEASEANRADAAARLPRHARSDGEHRAGAGRLRRPRRGPAARRSGTSSPWDTRCARRRST